MATKAQFQISNSPEVLNMVLDSGEVQTVSQGLVVDQSLGGRTPVHIYKGNTSQSSGP